MVEIIELAQIVKELASAIKTTNAIDPNRLQPFKGKPCESFEKFINKFNRMAQANDWDDEMKRKILPYHFEDHAADYYDQLEQFDRATFDKIVTKLNNRFCRGRGRRQPGPV